MMQVICKNDSLLGLIYISLAELSDTSHSQHIYTWIRVAWEGSEDSGDDVRTFGFAL